MKTKIELTHTISLDKDFFEFLKQKDCLEQYFSNLKNRKKSTKAVKEFFEYQKKEGTLDGVLYQAFCWMETPEGHDFWSKIVNEWNKLCYPEWCKGRNCEVKALWVDLEAWTKVFEFNGGLLVGRQYSVRDNSWNRPALTVWQKNVWNFSDCNTGWINVKDLCPVEGVLILSDYPIEKVLVNGPAGESYSHKFIKVLLPDGRIWWVIYNESYVL